MMGANETRGRVLIVDDDLDSLRLLSDLLIGEGYDVRGAPDAFPDKGTWKALETLHKDHPAAWMIWEDEPLPESVKRLETMDVRSIVFNPCGNRPGQGDFMTVMKQNLENLRVAVYK